MARDDLLLEFLFGVVLENGTSADHKVKSDRHDFRQSLSIREQRLSSADEIGRMSLITIKSCPVSEKLYESPLPPFRTDQE